MTYAIYIGAAYGVSGAVVAGIVFQSVRAWRKIRKQVEALDA